MITHLIPMWALSTWKKLFCKKNWHLFDEVISGDENYLSCDACKLIVYIEKIDNQYVE